MRFAAILVGCLSFTASAAAQVDRAPSSGAWAMPGLHRVLVASEVEPGVDAALMGGWGYTEDVLGTSDSHHRLGGSAAFAGRPVRWLTIAGRVDGRYDVHLSPSGNDEAGVGEPRVAVRGDYAVGGGVTLGLAAIVFIPGSDAPSLVFEATTLDLRALASYRPEGLPIVLALDVGYRLDNTARAVPQPLVFRRADLVTLGASSSDAVLLGLGAMLRVDAIDLFLEATADLFVETPGITSVVRLAGGVRAPLVPDLLAFQGTLEVGLTDRIGPIGGASLFPVEPRAAITLGLVLSPRSTPAALVDDPDDLQADTITPPDLSVERRTLHGAIAGPDGEALPGVHVRAVDPAAAPGTRPFGEATTVADGSFAIEGVPIDRAVTLEIEADGFTTTRVEVAAGSDGALASAVSLARALPRGALRGLVRTTRGAPIPATVRVEGSDETATADRDGVFELALLPGSYTIVIEAEGRVSQHRTIEVEEGGVTVLNVELRSGH